VVEAASSRRRCCDAAIRMEGQSIQIAALRFVYDRIDAKVANVCNLVRASNFVKSIDPNSGILIGRRDFKTPPMGSSAAVDFRSDAFKLRTREFGNRTRRQYDL
jgi:hypothetical protein